jgi:ubiquinone/menaquinone biosynthesis C-methylase UbiE
VVYAWDKEVKETGNLTYEIFERLDLSYGNRAHLMHKKMKLVLNYVKPAKSLIDIGCGTGEFIFQLKDRFESSVGIDVNHLALDFASKKVGKDEKVFLYEGELDSFHFPREHFDICLCLDVLEHVRNLYPLVQEIYRILLPKGEMIVTVPNWYDIITTKILRKKTFHVNTFTPWKWMGLFQQAGFRIRFYRAVEFPLVKSDFLARKVPILGMCILMVAVK